MTGWQIWHSDGLQTISKSVRLPSQNAWPNTTGCWKSNHPTIEVSVPQIHLSSTQTAPEPPKRGGASRNSRR